MESSPLVSVILPTYNQAKYLQRSIESVLAQTYLNWELVVWDDGSTDNSKEIVNSFSDHRIKYYFERNHGAPYARNRAIEISQGIYLALLDSDDQWVDDKLSVQVKVMDSNPNIDVLFTDFLSINYSTNEKNLAFGEYSGVMKLLDVQQFDDSLFIINSGFLNGLVIDNFIASDTIILRREVLGRIGGFNESLRNSDDFELWWRMGLTGVRMAYIDKVYLNRYKYPGSLSSPSILTYKDRLKLLNLCFQESLQYGQVDLLPLLKSQYRNAWQNLIPLYCATGNKRETVNAFFQSLRYGCNLGSFRLFFEAISGRKLMKKEEF